MALTVKRIEKEDWKQLAGPAHMAVFKTPWDAEQERIDFALITVDDTNTLCGFATVRELDGVSSYLCYGGSFPNYRGSISAFRSFQLFIAYLFETKKMVSFHTDGDNFPMLKFAIREKFSAHGGTTFQGTYKVEFRKMKEEK